jgi:hypothetical protein
LVFGLLGPGPAQATAPSGEAAAYGPAVASERLAGQRWAADGFAKRWARAANRGSWTWVRRHSYIAGPSAGQGVSLADVKWSKREQGRLKVKACGPLQTLPPGASISAQAARRTRQCSLLNDGGWMGTSLYVQRRPSGRLIAVYFAAYEMG